MSKLAIALRATLLSALSLPVGASCGGSTSLPEGGSQAGGATGTGGSSAGGSSAGGASAGGKAQGGSGVAGSGVAGSGAGGSPSTFVCKNPTPGAADSGLETCEGGVVHRKASASCKSQLPRAATCEGPGTPTCSTDADCRDKGLGFCEATSECAGPCQLLPCGCSYGCLSDADCAAGELCQCGDPVGRCVAGASCRTDADCNGSLCVENLGDCGFEGFSCLTAADACVVDADCGANKRCRYQDGKRVCLDGGGGCAVGRPLVVEGGAIVARLQRGGDEAPWC